MADQAPTKASSTGWNDDWARAWVDQALRIEDVEQPWRMATALVAMERPETKLILDAASGPGGFLAVALDTFPEARGVWFDVSETMRGEAERQLERFGDRVEFVIGDLVEIEKAGKESSFDLVTSSRATHHLPAVDLGRFYRRTAGLLAPGGWIANVDSMTPPEPWKGRLRSVRGKFRAAVAAPDVATHVQLYPSPFEGDHFAGARAAGLVEAQIIWRSFVTGLFMARKPEAVA